MANEIPARKERQHLHHCPICDKFRKIVQANSLILRRQAYLIFNCSANGPLVLDKEETLVLANALLDIALQLNMPTRVHHLKKIQNMTDEQVQAYAENIINRKRIIFQREETCDLDGTWQTDIPVPKLELIKGGKYIAIGDLSNCKPHEEGPYGIRD